MVSVWQTECICKNKNVYINFKILFSVDNHSICHDQSPCGGHLSQCILPVDQVHRPPVLGDIHRRNAAAYLWGYPLAGVFSASVVGQIGIQCQDPVICCWSWVCGDGHSFSPDRCYSNHNRYLYYTTLHLAVANKGIIRFWNYMHASKQIVNITWTYEFRSLFNR